MTHVTRLSAQDGQPPGLKSLWGDSVWELTCDFWLGAKAPTLTNRVWGTQKVKGKDRGEKPCCRALHLNLEAAARDFARQGRGAAYTMKDCAA